MNIVLLNANVIINENTTKEELLPKSEFYIDKTKSLTLKDIREKDLSFKYTKKSTFSFGYSPDFNLWIKTTISNQSNRTKKMIVEYNHPLTTHLQFFNPNKNYIPENEGLFFTNEKRKTVHPHFIINIKAHETKTYYMKVSTYITTLIVNLRLWDNEEFYKKELLHHSILFSFFGAMIALLIYNLFIFFFTKDISYFYYVLYIFAITFHHLIFVGISNIYLFDTQTLTYIVNNSTIIVAFPVLALGLFTKSFLKLEQYPLHNKILNILLILIPINLFTLMNIEELIKYRNILSLIILTYLMYVTIYALYNNNKQAKFIFIAWVIFFMTGVLMILSSIGIFNIYEYIPYFLEVSFITEAIIFSVALSNRIKILQVENDDIHKALIIQQENEKERLEQQVLDKTKDLNVMIEERDLLLRELNHRVKNNMQTIVSLIRLQNDKIDNKMLKNILITIQNRINAMSYLHELLYTQNDVTFVNTSHYFRLICEEIQASYNKNIYINLNVKAQLKIEEAMYCGLVLNELITNTFKYAYPNNEDGEIYIYLTGNDDIYELVVYDTGIGYEGESNSLGLIIVENLVKRQLKGDIQTFSKKGVKHIIKWGDK